MTRCIFCLTDMHWKDAICPECNRRQFPNKANPFWGDVGRKLRKQRKQQVKPCSQGVKLMITDNEHSYKLIKKHDTEADFIAGVTLELMKITHEKKLAEV